MAKKKSPNQRKKELESKLRKQQAQGKPLSKKQKEVAKKQREQLRKINQKEQQQKQVQEQRQIREVQQQRNIANNQAQKKSRERHVSTYAYIQVLKEQEFNGNNIDETSYPNLIELEDAGFVPAYIGGDEIPVNVQYVLHGVSMNDPDYKTGNLNIIVLASKRSYRRGKRGGYETPPSITIIQVPATVEKYTFKTKPIDDFETTFNKILEKTPQFIKEYSNNKMIYVDTLGFYYDE